MFIELPLRDTYNKIERNAWINSENIVCILDFEGSVRLVANNATEAATVVLDTDAASLAKLIATSGHKYLDLEGVKHFLRND